MQSLPKVFIGGIFCFLFYGIRLFFCSTEQISTYPLTAIHMDYMSNCGCHYCSFTPISPPDSKGYIDLTIKVSVVTHHHLHGVQDTLSLGTWEDSFEWTVCLMVS